MNSFLIALEEEGKIFLGTTKIWSCCDDETKNGYFLEFDKKVLHVYIALDNRHCDSALFTRLIHPKEIIFKEKKIIGNYENCELFFKDCEGKKTYILLSNGTFIGEAYFEVSDRYHPKGNCDFSHARDIVQLKNLLPK